MKALRQREHDLWKSHDCPDNVKVPHPSITKRKQCNEPETYKCGNNNDNQVKDSYLDRLEEEDIDQANGQLQKQHCERYPHKFWHLVIRRSNRQ